MVAKRLKEWYCRKQEVLCAMTKDRANTRHIEPEKAEVRAPTYLVIARMIAAELGRASNGDQRSRGQRRHQFLLENLEGTEL